MSDEFDDIKAAIARLQQKRQACDEAIKSLEVVLASLDPRQPEHNSHATDTSAGQAQPSYVQLAIQVLEELGRPTPITVLLERICERRNDPSITRGSVETCLLRHVTAKGEDADVVKPSPGTYALRRRAVPQHS